MTFRRRLAANHEMAMPPPEDVRAEALSGGHVTQPELERVRLFYSSLSSQVVVCGSLSDVLVGSVGAGVKAERLDSVAGCCWVHLLTGVPVLVLSVGSARRRRELKLVVADRSTALPLWQDRINSMSAFRQLAVASSGAGRLFITCAHAASRYCFWRRLSVCLCVCPHKIWKTTGRISM